MKDQPNDRPQAQPAEQPDIEPKLFAVVDGEKFPRPALQTMFADSAGAGGGTQVVGGCSCNPVVYCSCNKVASTTAVPTCSCVGHTACSCVGNSSGGSAYGCQCAPVH